MCEGLLKGRLRGAYSVSFAKTIQDWIVHLFTNMSYLRTWILV